MPSYNFGNLWYWVVVCVMALVAGYFLFQMWSKRISAERKGEKVSFVVPIVLTILVLFGLVMLYVGQGRIAPNQQAQLQPAHEVNQKFVDSMDEEAKALEPQTRQELVNEREAKETEKREKKLEEKMRANKEVGESISDFRAKMLQRTEPNSSADNPLTENK